MVNPGFKYALGSVRERDWRGVVVGAGLGLAYALLSFLLVAGPFLFLLLMMWLTGALHD